MSRPILDPERLDDFARRIAAGDRRRLDRAAIWNAFAAAFPGRPQGADEREWLRVALEDLSARGVVRLPSLRGRRWDRAFGVALPLSIDVARELHTSGGRTWQIFPWHAHLQWVGDLRALRPPQEQFLRRVHEGLVAGWFETAAPIKYRSLQLTGGEKQLGNLAKTSLFSAGRLSLKLLGCIEDAPPLVWQVVAERPAMVVFENAGPFAVARRVLASLADPPYGYVACGEGKRFCRSVIHLTDLRGRLERIDYVGDLDIAGIRIAANARRRLAIENAMPDLLPATRLHQAMLDSAERFGHPLGWPCESARRRPEWSDLEFLSGDVLPRVRAVLEKGRRIPEEVLGPCELTSAFAEMRARSNAEQSASDSGN